MPRSAVENEEASHAQSEAVRGAGYGALKWGVATAFLGGLGQVMSPIYRGLTIQFKVYIQMSGMILGGMLEADARVRRYEQQMRMQRMIARDRAYRERLEKELMDDDDDDVLVPPPPPKQQQQQQESTNASASKK